MSMRNQSEINKSIHVIDPSKPVGLGEPLIVGYADKGKHVDVNSKECLAKAVTTPEAAGDTKYFIKRATMGAEAGRIFNPHSPNFSDYGSNRFWSEIGRAQYEFKPATKAAFELYLHFLTTGNLASLRQAEREI